MSVDLVHAARDWAAADPDPVTRAATAAMIDRGDPVELAEHFGATLEFGTAGLRAPLGPGPARMNRLVVRRVAAALSAHLLDRVDRVPRLVVGHDARHGSAAFADEVVAVCAAAGLEVERFDQEVPTPLLATAVTERAADAGVMVTASHNPATDNGLKVYDADGAQLAPPHDADIAARMRLLPLGPAIAPGNAGRVRSLGGPRADGPVVQAYMRRATSGAPATLGAPMRIARTSLHGVGGELCARALAAIGGLEVVVVRDQEAPDPDFPTAPRPNPEDSATLAELLATAAAVDADAAIALDPDADRLAVALPDRSGTSWRALTGDQIGALLASYLLESTEGSDRLIASTVVSSRLVPAMCRRAGIHHVETLTGFKWLCRPGLSRPDLHQLLLYEEALGYAVGPSARDKDGISAAVVLVAALDAWRTEGLTPWDVLDELARRHGLHVQRNGSVRPSAPGTAAVAALVGASRRLVDRPPSTVAGRGVERTDRPAPDVARWYLEDGTRVVLRPSGTEPKVKYYLEAIRPADTADDPEQAHREVAAELDQLGSALADLLAAPA